VALWSHCRSRARPFRLWRTGVWIREPPSGRAKDFGKLSRATSASSVELFTLALWRQPGATFSTKTRKSQISYEHSFERIFA